MSELYCSPMNTQSRDDICFAGTTDAIHTRHAESNCTDQGDAIPSVRPLDVRVES